VTPARRALTRRALIRSAGAAVVVVFAAPARAAASGRPVVTVYKSPT
jgi:hypothetical protein